MKLLSSRLVLLVLVAAFAAGLLNAFAGEEAPATATQEPPPTGSTNEEAPTPDAENAGLQPDQGDGPDKKKEDKELTRAGELIETIKKAKTVGYVLIVVSVSGLAFALELKELPVELPDSAAAIEVRQEDDLLVIAVNRQGELFIDAQPVSTEMLHERLQEAARKTPQPRIRIDGDCQTTLQQLVQILDLCQFERLNRVGIHIAEDRAPGKY